jgi:uncharacterized protein
MKARKLRRRSNSDGRAVKNVLPLWRATGRRNRRAATGSATTACCAGAVLICLASLALAFDFPPLTGRVVDQANVLTPQAKSDIEAKSKELEDKSGIQLVVATVKSLQGSDVESYANQLFRFWKLGQAQKNNGVLLLVAPNEHKVRIEVGYGLEGTLTDALSSVIISSAIVPRFKANDFSGGITRGVDGIISVLSGDTADWQPKVNVRRDDQSSAADDLFMLLFVLVIIFIVWSFMNNRGGPSSGRFVRRGGRVIFIPTGGFGGSGWGGGFDGGGGGGFGGGFSGGGGSSGGGGASGSW